MIFFSDCFFLSSHPLFRLLDNLQLTADDRVYVALNVRIQIDSKIYLRSKSPNSDRNSQDSTEREFALVDRLRTEYGGRPWKIEHTLLSFQTRGAAETVFVVLQGMTADRLGRKTISLDCDTLYFTDVLGLFRACDQGLNVSFYFDDGGEKPVFSYIQMDEASRISDIREKIPISNHANTGAYAFASGTQVCLHFLSPCSLITSAFISYVASARSFWMRCAFISYGLPPFTGHIPHRRLALLVNSTFRP